MRISHLAIGLILESEVTVIVDQYQCVKADITVSISEVQEILSSLVRVCNSACIMPYIHASFILKCMYLFTPLY